MKRRQTHIYKRVAGWQIWAGILPAFFVWWWVVGLVLLLLFVLWVFGAFLACFICVWSAGLLWVWLFGVVLVLVRGSVVGGLLRVRFGAFGAIVGGSVLSGLLVLLVVCI